MATFSTSTDRASGSGAFGGIMSFPGKLRPAREPSGRRRLKTRPWSRASGMKSPSVCSSRSNSRLFICSSRSRCSSRPARFRRLERVLLQVVQLVVVPDAVVDGCTCSARRAGRGGSASAGSCAPSSTRRGAPSASHRRCRLRPAAGSSARRCPAGGFSAGRLEHRGRDVDVGHHLASRSGAGRNSSGQRASIGTRIDSS